MSPFKLLIFDFDGTICCSKQAIAHSLSQTFIHFGYQLPSSEQLDMAIATGKGLSETFISLNPDLTKLSTQHMQQWINYYRQIYLATGIKYTRLFDGMSATLHHINQTHIAWGIVSKKGESAIIQALKHFKLEKYPAFVIGDRPAIEHKPSPVIYHTLIQPLFSQIKPSDILVIGDTTFDLGFANNIGAKSCWAAYGYGNKSLCLAQQPHFICQTPHELSHIITSSI